MRLGTLVYALFCCLVVTVFTVATITSSSPFTDGGRSAFFHGSSGPHHK